MRNIIEILEKLGYEVSDSDLGDYKSDGYIVLKPELEDRKIIDLSNIINSNKLDKLRFKLRAEVIEGNIVWKIEFSMVDLDRLRLLLERG